MPTWTADGRCPCGGSYQDREVEIQLRNADDSQTFTLSGVAQGVCPKCGSRVYTSATLRRIEIMFHARPARSPEHAGVTDG